MKHEINAHDTRDRPEASGEKNKLAGKRKSAARARKLVGIEDTAFLQAERENRFLTREKKEESADGEGDIPKTTAVQKGRIRRNYALKVRDEFGLVDVEKSAGKIEENGGGRRKKKSGSHFFRAAGSGEAVIRGTAGRAVMSGKETDQTAFGTVETVSDFTAAGTGTMAAADRNHFSQARAGDAGRQAVIGQKDSPFYGGVEAQASAEAVRQKAAREFQRHQIRKNYQTAPESIVYIPIVSRIRERARARSGEAAAAGGKSVARKAAEFFEQHPLLLVILLLTGILSMLIGAAVSGGTMLMTGTVAPSTLATTYTAENEDIRGAEADYCALEADLSTKINHLESSYPGYASYELSAGQIGHDPYKLAALLTVLHQDYKRADVQDDLKKIFNTQYNLTLNDETGEVEKKKVRVGQSLGKVVTSGYCGCSICCGQWAGGATASGAMPKANHTIAVDAKNPIVPMGTKIIMNGIEYTVEDTGNFAKYGVAFDVYYDDHSAASAHGHKTWEAYIADDKGTQEVEVLVSSGNQQFSAVLKNNGIDYVAEKMLSKDDKELYDLLVETKGNKPELFADNIYVGNGEGWFDYTVAGDALSDQKFAGMMAEAKKYLGYPYVWGGSSPSTSFDCSGFVCWVINHSGNGWNVGRTTADGLCNMLPKVDPSEAKPGDIIFFKGTYSTSGASHVGIYLGDNMMIHCGSPIQYARIDTPYWKKHFYCFGRLPSN